VTALGGQPVAGSARADRDSAGSPVNRDRTIAVLPFLELSEHKGLDYFCDGIAEEIIGALSTVPGVLVVASSSAFQIAKRTRDVREIGSLLNVGTVLEGSVRASGDRLRITARLVATADATQIWSQRFDFVLDDVFAVQEQIANAAVQALGIKRSALHESAVVMQTARNVEAYTEYLKGRHCWNRRTEATLRKSVDYFVAALDKEPNYLEALAGLAEAYTMLGVYGVLAPREVMPKARSAAERAIALDAMLPSPHATLGCIAANYDWEWEAADRHFHRALALDVRESVAHHWYAINCLVPLGRFVEARHELQRATDADPLSMAIRFSHGVARYFADEFIDAEREIAQSLELDPGASTAHLFLGLTLIELGRYADAIRAVETAQRLSPSPEMTAALGLAAARYGDRDRARSCVTELQRLSQKRYVSPSLIGQVHSGLGERTLALDLLESAVSLRAADLAWLAVRPVFRDLRGEPRFQRMLGVLGLGR
jgi:serine/threonine-protein kinase